MAAVGVIAKKRDESIKRIIASADVLTKALAIDTIEIPTSGRDLNYLQAEQLAAVADILEAVVQNVSPHNQGQVLLEQELAKHNARIYQTPSPSIQGDNLLVALSPVNEPDTAPASTRKASIRKRTQ